MKYKLIHIFLVVYWLLGLNYVHGQKTVQVAEKSVQKTYEAIQTLEVKAEKATIYISSSTSNDLHISMKLLSKHMKKETALTDLDAIEYNMDKTDGTLIVSNFFEADNQPTIKSNLSVEYQILVPKSTAFRLKTLYSDIEINELQLNGKLDVVFGNAQIINCTGNLNIYGYYGEITLMKNLVNLTGNSEKTKLHVHQHTGSIDYRNDFGSIHLHNVEKAKFMNFNTTRTTIDVYLASDPDFSMYLRTSYGNIKWGKMQGKVTTSDYVSELKFPDIRENYKIQISTTYNQITIHEK